MKCSNCENMVLIDKGFMQELQDSLAKTSAELVAFCNKKKIDYRTLPALEQLGICIREFQDIKL